jgi:serine/threonine protein kinase
METATTRTPALRAAFEDALGKRHHAVAAGGEPIEVFELREEFSTEAFESAVRERVAALGGFQTACFSRIHTVLRPNQGATKLFVVSERMPSTRLSTVLAGARQQLAPLELSATLCVIRQLVAAIALLHEKLPTIAHGAISAERIVITPNARLVVVDHMLGSALDQLHYAPERYWKELRVPLPSSSQPAFDQRADVMQIGAVALELILGRPVDRTEYPDRIEELTDRAWRLSGTGGVKPLPPELRSWLLRMLQVTTEEAFASAVDAWADLERVLGASSTVGSFSALESVIAKYGASTPAASVAPTAPSMPAPERTESTAPSLPAPVRVASTAPSMSSPVRTESTAPSLPSPVRTESTPPSLPAPVRTESTAGAAPTPLPSAAPSTVASFQTPPASPAAPTPVVRLPEVAFAQASVKPGAPLIVPVATESDIKTTTPPWRRRWVAAAAVLIVLGSGGALFGRFYLLPPAEAEATGTLVVSTNPAGVSVVIDGQTRGVTPLTLELAPGSHELRLAADGGEPRIIPVIITAGSSVSHTIELPKVAPLTGQLNVRTEPSGARVTIDGAPGGTTPLTLEGLTPGPHTVLLATDVTSVTQVVTIEAGNTASLVVPMTAPQGVPVSGWISIVAPAEVQVYEDTRLLGTSQSDRIMVSAGAHELLIVNEALGYRATRSVTVSPGKVSSVRIDWPKGTMALNAQPWADVWIDGERVGETPIGSIAVPIGRHEIIFRHPQLGEHAVSATVTATTLTRVSVDMRKR